MSSSTDQSALSFGGMSNISPAVDSAYEPSESVTDSERSVAATRSAAASFTSLHMDQPSTMLESILNEDHDEASTATHVQANVTIQTTARGEQSSSSSSLGGGDSPSDDGQTMMQREHTDAKRRIGKARGPSILQRKDPARLGTESIHDQDPRSEPLSRSRVERFHSVDNPTGVNATAETTPGMRHDTSITEGIYKDDLQVTRSAPKVMKGLGTTSRTDEIEPTRLNITEEDYADKDKTTVPQGVSDTNQGVTDNEVRATGSASDPSNVGTLVPTTAAISTSSLRKPTKAKLLSAVLTQGGANVSATASNDLLDDDASLSTLGEKSHKGTTSVKSRIIGIAKGTIKGATKASRLITGRRKHKDQPQNIDDGTSLVSSPTDHETDIISTGIDMLRIENGSPEVIDLNPNEQSILEDPIDTVRGNLKTTGLDDDVKTAPTQGVPQDTKTAPTQGVPQDTTTAPTQGVPQDTKTAPNQEDRSKSGSSSRIEIQYRSEGTNGRTHSYSPNF